MMPNYYNFLYRQYLENHSNRISSLAGTVNTAIYAHCFYTMIIAVHEIFMTTILYLYGLESP